MELSAPLGAAGRFLLGQSVCGGAQRMWIAIGAKDWAPKIEYPRVRIVRFREPYLTNGIETSSPAPTISAVARPRTDRATTANPATQRPAMKAAKVAA